MNLNYIEKTGIKRSGSMPLRLIVITFNHFAFLEIFPLLYRAGIFENQA